MLMHTHGDAIRGWSTAMKSLTILGILALCMLLVLSGAVFAANTATFEGSIQQPAPTAAFTASPLTNSWVIGVAPLTVTFTDQSTVPIGTIDSWKWEYNAGAGWVQFSTAQNPEYTFNTPGAYDIRLTVSNSGGSSTATKTHFVAVAYERDPLVTVASGTVSGDLYFNSVSPWPATETTQSFTLPAAGSNIAWARVFVNDYSGSGDNNFFVKLTTEIDANGDGDYLDAGEVLGVEICDLQSEKNGHAYPLNDHVMKVYSDYEAWYDVTGLITSTNPSIHVKAEAVTDPAGSQGFDGRIKGITLVVAYNDGDSDQVKYIVNHGNDWMGPAGATGSTTFDASSFGSGWTDATVKSVAHSSTDATYTFNAGSPTKTQLGTNSYWKYNSFDVKSLLTSGPNTFGYTAVGSSFKITTAALTARYTAPTAAFTWTPTSPDKGTSVSFDGSASTGSITSYAWDFGDGNPGSGVTTSHTYANAGDYTVRLTVTGPLGSNSVEHTIHVKETAPVADFTATPLSGNAPLTVQFTDASTGVVTGWAWDFDNNGVVDSIAQNPTYTYTTPGTYTVKLTVTGPDYSDDEVKANYISVGTPTITVEVSPETVSFGQMVVGDNTGSTSVAVTTDGGTAWSVSASANNGGYMKDGAKTLAQAFQLANGGGSFQAMTSPFTGFMTGAADEDRTDTANVKQVRESGDQPGSYSITLTFTGAFS